MFLRLCSTLRMSSSFCGTISAMLSLIRYFLMTMGVIFLLLIFGAWYIWQTNFWNVQMLAPLFTTSELSMFSATSTAPLPEQFSAALEGENGWIEQFDEATRKCFEERFGEERVGQIEAGDTPTMNEVWQGASCLQ